MNSKKVMVQAAICIAIFTAVKMDFAAKIPKTETIETAATVNYSTEEIVDKGQRLWNSLKEIPVMINSAVNEANSLNLYGEPLESTKSDLKHVYAARGGNVEKSGIDGDYGLYIIIDHGDASTVYGNLNKINVVAGDRVKKGDIIGSYDAVSGKEFYYTVK